MAAKKEKFEEWKKGKDYIMWTRLKEMCDTLDLTSSSFISYVDLGGLYWEPLLELIYKYGNILKKTYKLKEIKMEYIRPLNYLGAQSDIEVVFDNDKYFVPKLASGKASQARFSFSHLIDSIRNVDNLNETNYTKECKTFKSDFNNFLKNLSSFVYEKDENGLTGYRYLTENIKLILYPLRMLRKSAYRLFSVEKLEAKYQDLMTFTDKNDIKLFVEGVAQFMESETYKQNKNCDVNELDKYMERALTDESYKYTFNDKIHVEEKKIERDDKGNPKVEDKKTIPKSLTVEEMEKLKNEENRKKLTLINIKKLEQDVPNTFVKEALQKDLEIGFDLMYKFLNKKISKDYPFPIDTHKIFVNLFKIPKGREIFQIEYYLGQLHKFIEQLKLMSYEMKLNGLVRTLIPIQANTEYIAVLKKIYDMHNIIDRILGDKLLYEQYLFIYDMIKFVHDSPMREDLELYKPKKFMEQNLPKYIFYMSMVKSSEILKKFQQNSRKDGGHFTIDQYYQPLKHDIDGANNVALNAYEKNAQMLKTVTPDYAEHEKAFWGEVNQYGRFWLMEGYFPPEDRDKWITAIEDLSNINKLVQEDIRDMILVGNDDRYRNMNQNRGERIRENIPNAKNNIASNKVLNTESNAIDSVRQEKRKEKSSSRHLTKVKRNSSRKSTNRSKQEKDKDKKPSHRSDSLDSTDKIIVSLPHNKNGLRPPFVWNFPIERIEEIREKLKKEKEQIEEVHRNRNVRRVTKKMQKPKLEIVFKEENKKNEIRKVNAYPYYHDRRIEIFIDLLNELFNNCMKYSQSKGNSWEYVYCKILQVFGVEYVYSHPKEEPQAIISTEATAQDKNKEGEKKDGAKKEENKEEEKEKKEGEEENKNNEEGKEEKKEEKKEGESTENKENKENENIKEGGDTEGNREETKEETKNETKNENENKQETKEEEKNQS